MVDVIKTKGWRPLTDGDPSEKYFMNIHELPSQLPDITDGHK